MGLTIITRMVIERSVKKIVAAGLAAFWLMLPAQAGQIPPNAVPALTNWQAATWRFQRAGAFVGEDKYALAKAELSAGTTNLAAPYRTMASQFLTQLDSALQLSTNRNEPHRLQARSEEDTSELQSPYDLVCRLLLEKKNNKKTALMQHTSHHREHTQASDDIYIMLRSAPEGS